MKTKFKDGYTTVIELGNKLYRRCYLLEFWRFLKRISVKYFNKIKGGVIK